MLVLRREKGEALVIDGTVMVCVLAVEGNRVKLGIIAPDEMVVVRAELLDAERQQAQLRHKRAELEQITDESQREKLAQSVKRLEQSIRFTQPARAPALEMRQE